MLKKIISGGQTGADQGALHGARLAGLETGGTAPLEFRTELGPNSDLLKRYNLTESQDSLYLPRTIRNVLDSDGTLLIGDPTSPGSAATIKICDRYKKASAVLSLAETKDNEVLLEAVSWLRINKIKTLNVAGNRESKNPGIYRATSDFIVRLVGELEKE